MITPFRIATVSLLLCGVVACAAVSTKVVQDPAPKAAAQKAAPQPQAAAKPGETTQEACLKCHGPFKDLIDLTKEHKMESGEVTSPHRYIPHTSKEAKDIPDCLKCHEAHPNPHPGKKAGETKTYKVDFCFEKCHHQQDFTACKMCHQVSPI